jgi:site-specific recombinase XerD
MPNNLPSAPGLAPLVQGFFLDYLPSQRQVSPATLASYRDTLQLLLHFVEGQTHRPPQAQALTDWQAPMVLKFLADLEARRQNSPRTRNVRLAAVRTFMRFVSQQAPEHLALANRVLALPTKRYDRPLLGYLLPEELQALLQVPNPKTWSGRRDRLLFTLLYETGLRVSEILALNRQAIRYQRTLELAITGKGRKARCLPLSSAGSRQLSQWLTELAREPETPIFTNRFGQRLTRFGVIQRLRVIVPQAARACPSLRGRSISPHTFRHTTAMHLLQAGIELPQIAMWLGHTHLTTTHQYVELDLEMKKRCLQRLPKLAGRVRHAPLPDPLLKFLENL